MADYESAGGSLKFKGGGGVTKKYIIRSLSFSFSRFLFAVALVTSLDLILFKERP